MNDKPGLGGAPARLGTGEAVAFRADAQANWRRLEPRLDRLLDESGVSAHLRPAIHGILPTGGSHQRAALAPLIVTGRDGEAHAVESAAWAGIACEMAHLGTLLHDDIVDGNRTRRGEPSAWVVTGLPMAVLLGDLCISLGYRALSNIIDEQQRGELTVRYSAAVQRCQASQADELAMLERRDLPDEQWCDASTADKTGAFFEFGLFAGSRLAGAEVIEADLHGDIGRRLGVCFQIADDIDDGVWDAKTGIPGMDLWEGKPSWVIASGLKRATVLEVDDIRRQLYVRRERKTVELLVPLCHMLDDLRAIPTALGSYKERRAETFARIGSGDVVLQRLVASMFDAIDARMNLVRDQRLSTTPPPSRSSSA